MSAYRDKLPACPRCAGDLLDAGAGRACGECRGQWVTGAVVQEMMIAMQMPPMPVRLEFLPDPHEVIACPECTRAMETFRLHDVPIDRCPEWHGIWFDHGELQAVLLRSVRIDRGL